MTKTYTFTVTLTTEDEATIAKLDEPGVAERVGEGLSSMLGYFVRDLMAPWSVTVGGRADDDWREGETLGDFIKRTG